jgi:hypothetical protein
MALTLRLSAQGGVSLEEVIVQAQPTQTAASLRAQITALLGVEVTDLYFRGKDLLAGGGASLASLGIVDGNKLIVRLNQEILAADSEPEPEPEPAPEPEAEVETTFATSNFKRSYDDVEDIGMFEDFHFYDIVECIIVTYCQREDIPYETEGQSFMGELRSEAMANTQGEDIPLAAQRLWTSVKMLRGREFCSIVNDALRDDYDTSDMDPTAALTHKINSMLCVTTGRAAMRYPPNNVCFRGGGFDDRHRRFFVVGRKFRQPAFLATSSSEEVADRFMHRAISTAKVKWVIRIDSKRKCAHVNLVVNRVPGLPDEQEYLFTPYSAFTVMSVAWNAGTGVAPHKIELLAAADNKEEPEDLPLAPWS